MARQQTSGFKRDAWKILWSVCALMVQAAIATIGVFGLPLPFLPEPLAELPDILFYTAWMFSLALLPPTLARKPKAG